MSAFSTYPSSSRELVSDSPVLPESAEVAPQSRSSGVRDPELATQPNKYAPASGFRVDAASGLMTIDGYQAFELNPATIALTPHSPALTVKTRILENYLSPRYLRHRTILDLGGNNGYYSLVCLGLGAASSTVVDMDAAPIANLDQLNAHCPAIAIRGVQGNVLAWREPADVVFAFALIHWVYNLTTGLGSMDEAIAFLSGLTRDALFIEWVDPSDPVIVDFGHTTFSNGRRESDYSQEHFLESLNKRFDSVRLLGDVSPTRRLYLASRNRFEELDLSWDAPRLMGVDTKLIKSQQLVPGVWSRVYDAPDGIFKQCTPELGRNEVYQFSQCDHPSIPKVELISEDPVAVVFRLDRHPGMTLRRLSQIAPLSIREVEEISAELASTLAYLEAQDLLHCDLHPDNVLFDRSSGFISLIDFGWACRKSASLRGELVFPERLGDVGYFSGRRSGLPPSDIFAWGELTVWLLDGRHSPVLLAALLAIASTSVNDGSRAEVPTFERVAALLTDLRSGRPAIETLVDRRTLQPFLPYVEGLHWRYRGAMQKNAELETGVNSVRAEREAARAELVATRADLARTLVEVASTRVELAEAFASLEDATLTAGRLAAGLAALKTRNASFSGWARTGAKNLLETVAPAHSLRRRSLAFCRRVYRRIDGRTSI